MNLKIQTLPESELRSLGAKESGWARMFIDDGRGGLEGAFGWEGTDGFRTGVGWGEGVRDGGAEGCALFSWQVWKTDIVGLA